MALAMMILSGFCGTLAAAVAMISFGAGLIAGLQAYACGALVAITFLCLSRFGSTLRDPHAGIL
ncbi:MAG: hypothetical protein AAF665_08050 [Pseudomonadota bacterium]